MNFRAPHTRPHPPAHAVEDFRSFLQSELLRRCKANSKYSLRAFSRALGIEASLLSRLLSGKRRVTGKMFDRLAQRLALPPATVAKLKAGAGPGDPITADERVLNYRRLDADQFELIAEWYHYAILELMEVRGFDADVGWIARALGISRSEAKDAVARLFRLGFIRELPSGAWANAGGNHSHAGKGFTNAAFKQHQRQIVEQSLQAIDETPFDERDHSSVTLSIPASEIPRAKELIRAFRSQFAREMQARKPYDRVYQLSIGLFPVSRPTSPSRKRSKSS